MIAHGVMFTNGLYPRATTDSGALQRDGDWNCTPTLIRQGASVGSNATIVCGVTVGEKVLAGAGAVVTRDVPAFAIVAGNPARVIGDVRSRSAAPHPNALRQVDPVRAGGAQGGLRLLSLSLRHGRYTEVIMVRWMERLDAGEPPIILGDGLQTMDMIQLRDVARANILSAQSSASDVVLNVASETETSLLDLARALAAVKGRPDLEPIHQLARAVNPAPRRLGAKGRAEALLGFRAEVPLFSGIGDLVRWWRDERAGAPREEKIS